MSDHVLPAASPLRIFCIEDNPLIVFHLEGLIEDIGHIFAGFTDSFAGLQRHTAGLEADGALVDIDLADGCTGLHAAMWLHEHGILALATIIKPVTAPELARNLELFRGSARSSKT
jgi:CheY-like chemotaxis protein